MFINFTGDNHDETERGKDRPPDYFDLEVFFNFKSQEKFGNFCFCPSQGAFLFLLTVLGLVLLIILILILIQEGKVHLNCIGLDRFAIQIPNIEKPQNLLILVVQVFIRWVARTRHSLSRPPSYNTVTKPPRYRCQNLLIYWYRWQTLLIFTLIFLFHPRFICPPRTIQSQSRRDTGVKCYWFSLFLSFLFLPYKPLFYNTVTKPPRYRWRTFLIFIFLPWFYQPLTYNTFTKPLRYRCVKTFIIFIWYIAFTLSFPH